MQNQSLTWLERFTNIKPKITRPILDKLRRIALEQQGLLRNAHYGRGKQATLRTIEQIGYVQIDTISVVERAHHHVLFSRVPNYQPKFLEQLVKQRAVFEYWFHAAAWLPMQHYRYALPRMTQVHGERGWFDNCEPAVLKDILKRVENEGALRARDFDQEEKGNTGWWDWKPAKQALEQLFFQGELMVTGREGFQKIYDLPERVLPDWVDTSMPDIHDYAAHLIEISLRAHGYVTLKSISYLRKGRKLRDCIKQQIEDTVAAGQLMRLKLGANEYFIEPEKFESRAPRSSERCKILSPFDNSVIQRDRGRDIFNYDYQIECYVPESKRQYGYFCLPILYRDQFVGRMDCKAHRKQKTFQVKTLHLEQQMNDEFYRALFNALDEFAEFNQCRQLQINDSKLSRLLPLTH
ncbi:MAG: crosslink repair DNA glycosylase YcaQ family protein [Pseudomonadota bacterium]